MTNPNEQRHVLPRTMGLFALTIYGIGDMLGSGVYALMGKAAGLMGNALWLGFVTSMIAAMFTGLSYAALGARYPKAAGAAYVVQRAFNFKILAYTLGLMTMASGLTSMATASNAFSEQLQKQVLLFTGQQAPAPATTVPADVPAVKVPAATATAPATAVAPAPAKTPSRLSLVPYILAFIAALTFINYRGLKESTWMNAVCTFIEVGGLILVIAVGISYWGSVNYFETPKLPDMTHVPLTFPLVLAGGVLTFYAFVGFEDMLNVSEEVKDPEHTFPRALILAVVIVTVIYLAVAITAVSVVPHAELAKPGASLTDVVAKAAPAIPRWIFAAISLFAIANTALLNYIMGSRIVYGMARQGLLPSFLARLHPTRKTPHIAIFVLMLIVTALALSGGISDLASATSILLLIVFAIVNAALIVLKRRPGEPNPSFDVPSIVPLMGVLVCSTLVIVRLYDALTAPTLPNMSPPWRAPLVAGILVLSIVILYFVMRPKTVELED